MTVPGAGARAPGARGGISLRRALLVVLGIYAVTRACLLITAAVIADRDHLGLAGVLSPWDGGFYISIAEHGYPVHAAVTSPSSQPLAFFPLFPLVSRALAVVTRIPVPFALAAVSVVAGAAAALLGALLVARRMGPDAGLRAGALLAVFPGSVIAGLAYADALALAMSLGSLVAMQRQRYVLAGAVGVLATASLSLVGLPLVVALALGALGARRLRAAWAPLIAACGAGAYLVFLWVETGSPFTWSRVEHQWWLVHLSLPWQPLTAFSTYPFATTGAAAVTIASIVVAAVGLAALAYVRAPLEWVAYSVLVIAGVTFDGGAWIAPRFLFDAFPLVLAIGIALPRRALAVVCVILTVALTLLLAAYSPTNAVFFNP